MESTVELLVQSSRDISFSRYAAGASMTLLLYDWLLLASDEHQMIWKTRWTVPKFLYYFLRVVTIPSMMLYLYELSDQRPPLNLTFCRIWSVVIILPNWATISASNWLFTLRLLALYKRHRLVVWLMAGFFSATSAVSLGMVVATYFYDFKSVRYFPELNVCGAVKLSATFPAIIYTSASYEVFIFTLTAYRAYRDANVLSSGSAGSPILVILYRDGLICFIVMVVSRIVNIWIFLTRPVSSFGMASNLMWSLNTVLSTRVYLNLVWLAKSLMRTIDTLDPSAKGSVSIRIRVPTTPNVTAATAGEEWRRSIHPLASLSDEESEMYNIGLRKPRPEENKRIQAKNDNVSSWF